MARKSRKNAVNPSVVVHETAEGDVYLAGLYARISVENDRKIEADSIGNQIQLLRDFASEQSDISVFDVYCDDDVSGTDFSRPEFSRMMNDLRDGKINCIIVKDLSRLGRNFIESGEYIELVFPFLGCRFIAINDRFDSKFQQADISVQLKNLANEMYARDISQKITSAHSTLQQQGKWTGGHAPYGYLIAPDDRHRLIVDPETASVVKCIYELRLEGNSCRAIALTLTARGIPSPGRLRYDRGMCKTDRYKDSKWTMQTVKAILKDQIYLGWMVLGKTRSTYYTTGLKGTRMVPQGEWIITKGTHEPIITETLYNAVQEMFAQSKEKLGNVALWNSQSRQQSIFKQRLVCGECGKPMYLRRRKNHGKVSQWYYCALHEHYGSDYCTNKSVKVENLNATALRIIQAQIRLFVEAQTLMRTLNESECTKTKYKILKKQISTVKRQIEQYVARKAELYEDYSNGIINQDDYLMMGQEYAQNADELRIFLAELEKAAERYSPDFAFEGKWAELVSRYCDCDELTEEMVQAFIEKMVVHQNGHVEITFTFRDELDGIIHLAAIRRREVARYAI